MRILVSNDDGVNAPGLAVLAEALAQRAEVTVMAPDRDHSGASNSLTLTRPLRVQKTANGYYAVDGTPTDCVHLGISDTLGFRPERVVSGINTHANLGDDVLYSGTVAAAIEGRFLKQTPIAVSLVNRGNWHYDTAARVVVELLERLGEQNLPAGTVLNVNVPDVPWAALRGIRVTRLGCRHKGGEPIRITDPRGHERFWIALAGESDDAGPGTDFHAVDRDYVSVTPLSVDMSQQDLMGPLQEVLSL
ncbi:5'/3'-nucleotidase SurE [Hahella sp. SMD15-11]|uniref:5'-nucleotidase SurE n=1 Tax=Thermohahella caldifontis TaxID=3142973 RepID=A0AB39UZG5_9GAMM